MILSYTAHNEDSGRTVESILRRELYCSAALVRRLKQSGIYASGRPVYTNYRVTTGEIVTADIRAAEPPCGNIPERGEIEILFENDGLAAVNKPAGMLVHPSRARNTGTLANFVAGYLAESADCASCHAVNRLDRDTSGVVLFAKNSYMKARASAALSAPDAVKEYLAAVSGCVEESGTVNAPILRYEPGNMLRVTAPGGQRAVTHYYPERVVETDKGFISLLRLRLETGRTHQIRVHCLHIGCPLLGDVLYGTEVSTGISKALGITSQALHAERLGFTEPLSGKYVRLITPAPRFLTELFKGV